MSTRGAVGFRLNDRDYLTYNHSDSYPTGLGQDVLRFCQQHTPAEMRAILPGLVMVDEGSYPSGEQIREAQRYLQPDSEWSAIVKQSHINDHQGQIDWYGLLRVAQGDLEPYMRGLRFWMENNTFVFNALFCEWAYIINLDTDKLEIYAGGSGKKGRGRYFKGKPEYYEAHTPAEYRHGVTLVDELPLDRLREMSGTDISHYCEQLEEKKSG